LVNFAGGGVFGACWLSAPAFDLADVLRAAVAIARSLFLFPDGESYPRPPPIKERLAQRIGVRHREKRMADIRIILVTF
jgi:hypothetical protein